jgi:DNA-binding LacI/PurR family transcriptional regulator
MTMTIKDIAARLGVSTATVSRALNDKPGVSVEVRRRVLDLAADLSFAPNGTGRGLSTARTQTLGFVVRRKAFPTVQDHFYLQIMHGVEQEVARNGYHVILSAVGAPAGANTMNGANDLSLVREGRVDGLILAGPDIDSSLILELQHNGVPLVLIDNALRQTPVDCVLNDDREGAFAAVIHLIEHGYERIAFIGGPSTWISTVERRAGFEDALAARNRTPSAIVHQRETTVETGYAAMIELLEQDTPPNAVFAVNDSMAFGAMRAARENGLTVPGDLALVGFDDIDAAQHTTPPLTTVRIFKERVGEVAARRLLDRLTGPATPPQRTYVGTELIIRQSCGCPPAPMRREVVSAADTP